MRTALTDAQKELLRRYDPALSSLDMATILGGIIDEQVEDPGRCALNVLRLDGNVASAQTITIGADVYEINIVNTDSTKVTAGADLTNTTSPVQVTCAAHGRAVGDLIRVENEIMKVLAVPSANELVVSRGHSGTTTASHADGVAIYVAATPATGTRKEIGLVATLTPAAAGAAIAAVINAETSYAITATVISNSEVLITADAVGATVLACTETLATANNVWAAATMFGGRADGQRRLSFQTRVPTATEVALETMHFVFDFAPTVLGVFVYVTATPGVATAWNGAATVTGNRVTLNNAGITDWAVTDTVLLVVGD